MRRPRIPRPVSLIGRHRPRPRRQFPRVGGDIVLEDAEGQDMGQFRVLSHRGAARLLELKAADSEAVGLIALQPDGSWYWIHEPQAPEPWRR